jgi:hypothetical protein
MKPRLAHPSFALLLAACGVASGAHAQTVSTDERADQAVLPVYNRSSGKVEAFLLLEPADARAGARWRSGSNTLDAAFGLEAGDSLGVVCNREAGFASALGSLANNCLLASFDDEGSRRTSGTAAFGRNGSRLGITAGSGYDTLPAWLNPGNRSGGGAKVDVNDLTVFAQRNIGAEGMVSIAGTMAKATLMTPAEASDLGISDHWTSKSLSIGGGYGNFGASIIGHVIETPGQPKWEGLGVGLTWRTPWSGQLTVGADNVVTRGKNPFSPDSATREDEGTVPYVRYEQDL